MQREGILSPENGFGDFCFEQASDLMAVLSRDLIIIKANPAWTRAGYTPGELTGKCLLDHVHPEEKTELKQKFATAINGKGKLFELKCRFKVRDGSGRRLEFKAFSPDGSRLFLAGQGLFMGPANQAVLYDPLTNLPNRTLLVERTRVALADAKRNHLKIAFHFIDLNKFKPVNDTYGHVMGDHVLKIIAERLAGAIRESDTAARIGGDEFVVVQHGLRQGIHATLMAKRLLMKMGAPVQLESEEVSVKVGASIGISIFPDDSEDIAELINLADETMYKVKRSGREGYQFFNLSGLG